MPRRITQCQSKLCSMTNQYELYVELTFANFTLSLEMKHIPTNYRSYLSDELTLLSVSFVYDKQIYKQRCFSSSFELDCIEEKICQ